MTENKEKELKWVAFHYKKGALDGHKASRAFFTQRGMGRGFRLIPWAASVAAAVAIVLFLVTFVHEEKWIDYMADSSMENVTLPDGTEVVLSPGSSISIYEGKMVRKARMEGKVYFKVFRDESRPFEITGDEYYIRVLGTRFTVDAGDDTPEVYVDNGKVLFASAPDADNMILTAGMAARIAGGQLEQIGCLLNPSVWATGEFVYDNASLDKALEEIGDYFKVHMSASESGRRISGEFTADNINDIAAAIEAALDIEVTME